MSLPDPCLLAVLLTVSTHTGPQFVFHYPPYPDTNNYEAATNMNRDNDLYDDDTSDSSTEDDSEALVSDSDNDDNGDDVMEFNQLTNSTAGVDNSPSDQFLPSTSPKNLLERLERGRKRAHTIERKPTMDTIASSGSNSMSGTYSSGSLSGRENVIPEGQQQHNTQNSGSHHSRSLSRQRSSVIYTDSSNSKNSDQATADKDNMVLGFDTDFLGELLCPSRLMCNTKFEMTIDEMAFLGLPVHVLPDGQWKRRKHKKLESKTAPSTVVAASETADNKELSQENVVDAKNTNSNDNDNGNANTETGPSSGTSEKYASNTSAPTAQDQDETHDYTDSNSPMRMFHVVLVMNPSITEYYLRIDQMYHFVLSRFVSSLRTEQAKSNYVWNEVSTILDLKEKFGRVESRRDLWTRITQASNLAFALKQLFESIRANDICHVKINNTMNSFQIPVLKELTRLPAVTESYLKGSYLTTATSEFTVMIMANRLGDQPELINIYGILLFDDPEDIIKDMQANSYGTLADIIRAIDPTESLKQLAERTEQTMQKIIELAQSLVYWRRARFITPINHRNIYSVSPLADIGGIHHYSELFKERFPELPLTLPKLLSMLSTGKPRPYASHIPSRDHRDIYVAALAWIMRYGVVIHLRTFAFLKIPKRIKMYVKRDLQIDREVELSSAHLRSGSGSFGNNNTKKKFPNTTDTSMDNTTDNSKKKDEVNTGAGAGSKSPVPGSSPVTASSLSRGISTAMLRTPHHSSTELPSISMSAASASTHNRSDSDSTSAAEDDLAEEGTQESIVVDPSRATAMEKRWISKLLTDKTPEQQEQFKKLMKYFNGSYSLEDALALEDMSRQEWKKFRLVFDQYIIVVRHW